MKRARRHLLALSPALALSCAIYDSSLLEAGVGASSGGGAGAAGASSGDVSGASSGASSAPGAAGDASSGGGSGSGAAASGGDVGEAGADQGGSAVGGIGSDAGTSGGGGAPVSGELELLDDFETPDIFGPNENGRKPIWYLFDDMTTGTQEPLPLDMTQLTEVDSDARPGSIYALWTTASGFSDWGSGVGVDLKNAGAKAAYDLTAYAGISFYAKAPGSYRLVRVNLPDVGTDAEGGLCGTKCGDHFGKLVALTADWKRHDVLFEGMQQIGWGFDREAQALDQVYSVHFQSEAGEAVEIWLDDLSLILK